MTSRTAKKEVFENSNAVNGVYGLMVHSSSLSPQEAKHQKFKASLDYIMHSKF